MSTRETRSRVRNTAALSTGKQKAEEITKIIEVNTNTSKEIADTEVIKTSTRTSARRSQRTNTCKQEEEEEEEEEEEKNRTTIEQEDESNSSNIEVEKNGPKPIVVVENKNHDEDDFMRSEQHFPKICSRVGAKYQAVVPAFDAAAAGGAVGGAAGAAGGGGSAALKEGTQCAAACVWSPHHSIDFHDAGKCPEEEHGGGGGGEEESCELLERYLAQAKLIMSNFYRSQLNSHNYRGSNILSNLPTRGKGGVFDTKGPKSGSDSSDMQRDSGSEFDENDALDGGDSSSDEHLSDCDQQQPPPSSSSSRTSRKTPPRPGAEKKRGRPRVSRGRSSKQQGLTAAAPSNGLAAVDPSAPVIDCSFFMISSCLEDFLLELLHKRSACLALPACLYVYVCLCVNMP
jgi:hypothetical protein